MGWRLWPGGVVRTWPVRFLGVVGGMGEREGRERRG